jgi:hypothetical protein
MQPGQQRYAQNVTETRTNRSFVAVAIRADGSRVPVRLASPSETLIAKIDLLVVGLLALITGSRRESGGKRR